MEHAPANSPGSHQEKQQEHPVFLASPRMRTAHQEPNTNLQKWGLS
eukprot:CAMPEP_0169386850 /NCGR_PEP_ID=MMETSP1017-20121227/45014_1 /TAXON_ID=342587 /ORGANISM="Karlodinium micrum, Strain CCMP2283" /LENGTH=45 /DNA_ID= /DNA_START= /DNA_END= /DNA_ORIENTATION=